ncbi:hypothetical protein [Halorientalis salina]|uniref:hypothetical protein n=1 Tax=Halorientalis salina TaxID=2932266 RepID=UPI0010ABE28C|nr:hypothetical protein [Halorientalis salina]
MSELQDELQAALEDGGYEIGEVSTNRDTIRVVVLDEDAEATDLRSIATDVVDEDEMLALNVTTESIDGQDRMGTVVSFRHRPS